MDAGVLLALHLIRLTGPDGQVIEVNPEQVVELRQPRGRPGEHFSADVHCLIFETHGKYTAVVEDCGVVRQKLMETIR